MRRLRVAGGVAVLVGGLLLIPSPFLQWLGIRAPGFVRSFTLAGSLRELGRGDLLGPGMSAGWVVVAGFLAVFAAALHLATRVRAAAIASIVIGAAAGAYVAYLHGALEYGALAIAHLTSRKVETTPGAGLFLAVAGAAAVLIGGLLVAWTG